MYNLHLLSITKKIYLIIRYIYCFGDFYKTLVQKYDYCFTDIISLIYV